ncbi:hypothetical protein B9Z30_07160 [Taylorella equigenitalis]|nr:hypothetical protein B9Z30_07160 [Taylorella equigenitalis]KOS58798.1 hypothetical protein AM589_02465 [Taylorella equigenitalis]
MLWGDMMKKFNFLFVAMFLFLGLNTLSYSQDANITVPEAPERTHAQVFKYMVLAKCLYKGYQGEMRYLMI